MEQFDLTAFLICRDLPYKDIPVMTTSQKQSFEMKNDEDTGLCAERWIELSDGGDVHVILLKNKDLLPLHLSYSTPYS